MLGTEQPPEREQPPEGGSWESAPPSAALTQTPILTSTRRAPRGPRTRAGAFAPGSVLALSG